MIDSLAINFTSELEDGPAKKSKKMRYQPTDENLIWNPRLAHVFLNDESSWPQTNLIAASRRFRDDWPHMNGGEFWKRRGDFGTRARDGNHFSKGWLVPEWLTAFGLGGFLHKNSVFSIGIERFLCRISILSFGWYWIERVLCWISDFNFCRRYIGSYYILGNFRADGGRLVTNMGGLDNEFGQRRAANPHDHRQETG